MKAKYILRGLGLGMIITAAVMGAYTRSAVADARVAVLKEYGIGEEAVLTETLVDVAESDTQESDDTVSASAQEQITEPAAEESVATGTLPYNEELESEINSVLDAAEAAQQEAGPDGVPESRQEAESAGTPAGGQAGTVTIEISKGDDSGTVARKLYNAGLVENAAEYDAFLMQHGYDKKLNTGTKVISITDSWQDIAEKLAKR